MGVVRRMFVARSRIVVACCVSDNAIVNIY